MAKSNKSKWIIGVTGTALSAFVISQIGGTQTNQNQQTSNPVVTKSMSPEEKKYAQLDWSNYEINGVSGGAVSSDRQTSRS
ncbi:hypothetical protein [Bacillus sp. JJ1764]|uniref:hypothetical protein n=1 Tax=Bacillus sp. JJ1764 TaxID=3122964 RepID=UPI003000F8FB